MKSPEIYEAAKEKAFNKIRHLRDASAPQQIESDPKTIELYNLLLFSIGDREFKDYSFIMEEAETYSYEMFKEIVIELLKKYSIKHIVDDYKYDKRKGIRPPILAFVTEENKTLFIVTRVGIKEIDPRLAISIMLATGAKEFKTVMMSHEYAYRVDMTHNDDVNDPTRGTGIYSIKDMFVNLFGEEEYACFKGFEQEYTQNVRRYLGFQIVKTLTPNALYSFKKVVEYSLFTFSYKTHIDELSSALIPNGKYEAIRNQFITKKCYKALIGKSNFAQSFMTAEWLYDTMKNAGKIDYTAVSMGYFKAIEQLMYCIIKRHADEGRTFRKKRFVNEPGKYIELSEKNLKENKLDITLGSLISFLKFYKNKDLFLYDIRNDYSTVDGIYSIFDRVREDRNGYFHKDNIDKWEQIEAERTLTYVVMALLLGSLEFSEKDRRALNIPEVNETSDYNRLCEYMNYNSGQLFYICMEEGQENIPVLASADDNIEFDEYGDPRFSGAYYRQVYGVGSSREIVNIDSFRKHLTRTGENERFNELKMPKRIYTGVMQPVKEGMEFSGPLELIYDNGNLKLPEQLVRIKY